LSASKKRTAVEEIKADPRFKLGQIDMIVLAGGEVLATHGPAICTPPCAVHKPSNHGMMDWALNWRGDKQIFERICPHGVGHPDPDSVWYVEVVHNQPSTISIHGCDGCCR